MTAYATPTTVRVALSPGGDPTDVGSAASLSDSDLQDAIDEATAEVDGRIRGRYSLPFTTVPSLVSSITRDIAGYLATLTDRRGDPIPPGDPVALRYARAQTLLNQVATGALELDADPPTPAATSGSRPFANPYSGSLFGGETYLRPVNSDDQLPDPKVNTPQYIPPPYGM